jgi:hypothetical protein
MMYMRPLMEHPRAEHFLKQLQQEHGLKGPQFGGWSKVGIFEDLPTNVMR